MLDSFLTGATNFLILFLKFVFRSFFIILAFSYISGGLAFLLYTINVSIALGFGYMLAQSTIYIVIYSIYGLILFFIWSLTSKTV